MLSNDFPERIEETYKEIKACFPLLRVDSLKVIKDVIRHRNFWKPEEVKTVLLAESHVYTPAEENYHRLNFPEDEIYKEIPIEFVRLVYCLGYGEDWLIPHIEKNKGTPQYWKIFSACVSNSHDYDFWKVSKTETPYELSRLENKVNLLQELKRKGVWLVDCSIVGLYNFGKTVGPKILAEVLECSWDNYIKHLVINEKPDHVIVIGTGVGKAISRKLRLACINHTILPQPQARLSAEKHKNALRTYYEICNR